MKKRKFFRNHWGRSFWLLHCPPAMPLSQMFDKVFGMIKTDIREPSGGQTPENLENSENSTRDP